ncbi:MAG: S46 family peptidase [Vicingaceae bacterium]
MKRFLFAFTIILFAFNLMAKEGMWVPIFLEGALMDDMRSSGLKLSAEDIYSVNHSSLKDAVVRFGGGCTAEIISADGLLLTNHHCGYGTIQSHSSLENDYLTNGFWARSRPEELKNPGLEVTIIKSIKDVTAEVLKGVDSENERDSLIKNNSNSIVNENTVEGSYEAFIRPFFNGNQYILFITETFKDVRLVGAPPSSIGKYGFDTDNWVWPRHTGDFSIFRIYAGKDNKPAEFNESNSPYKPKHHLPISLKGYNEGDFTMVYGFPYRTDEYLTASAVDFIMNVSNPTKIKIRTAKLEVLNQHMREDDLVRIKYAAKQSSTSNAWKKWMGQNRGLQRNHSIEKKKKFEREFLLRCDGNSDFSEYKNIIDDLDKTYATFNQVGLARDYFVEAAYYSTDLMRFARGFMGVYDEVERGKSLSPEEKEKLLNRLRGFYKNYDAPTDQAVFSAVMPLYLSSDDDEYKADVLRTAVSDHKSSYENWASDLYHDSPLADSADFYARMSANPTKTIKSLKKDDFFQLVRRLNMHYQNVISPAYKNLSDQLDVLNRQYVEAIINVFPERKAYPDANGTLRLSYGAIEGMEPADGIMYDYYTTMEGVLEKYVPGSEEYDLPEKLIALHEGGDYGQYAQDGELRVCFIASNHTSGGNSGSPVLNANGELIGLNFDRNWEGTMSDISYDIDQCRNISVDIRYVLFIVDKFAQASYLIDELSLVN